MKKGHLTLNRKKILLITLLAILLIIAFALGSGKPTTMIKGKAIDTEARFEQELEDLRHRLRIPGMSAAIARGDTVIWSKGFGWGNIEEKIPVTPQSVFHLASLTKPYAATILLQLVEENKLDLNAPVSQFGIELESEDTIRIIHLLTHTSSGKPGTTYKYDGSRFGQLEQVIEKVTGNSFSSELRTRILEPMDLKETAPNPLDTISFMESGKDRNSIEKHFVTEYARKWGRLLWPSGLTGPLTPIDHPNYFGTAAGLVATARDVARFSGYLDQGKLLGRDLYEQSITPFKTENHTVIPFGISWFLEEYDGKKIVWHYGHWFGSSSLIVKIPEDRITFVILANSDGLSRRTGLGDKASLSRSPIYNVLLDHLIRNGL